MDKQPDTSILIPLRHSLLALHKILLDYEKRRYEGKFGAFSSVGAYFNAVTQNPSFAWLRQLSELIVSLDEMLEKGESHQGQIVDDFLKYTKKLLTISGSGSKFELEYFEAVKNDPAVAVAHGRAINLLKQI